MATPSEKLSRIGAIAARGRSVAMAETEGDGARATRSHRPHAERGERFPEFDALRATALLLVVTLHAALGYTRLAVPRLLWAVRDPSPHLGFDLFSWWAMGVSVPLFFAIGGFFAARMYESRGLVGFVANRVRRIVVPFIVASVIILPLCFLAWNYGWLVSGRCTYREICRMVFLDPEIRSDQYGPAHLWFLEYLILMLAGFAAFRASTTSRRIEEARAGRWLLAPWAPLALAIPSALLLKLGRDLHGIDAALDRHNSFVPDPVRLLYYAGFFAFGVRLHRARGRLGALAGRGPWYLLATVPLFAARAWLLRRDWMTPLDVPAALALAAIGGLLAWLNVFGLLGTYHRLFRRPSPAIRYLAGASYWIYLIHFPIVGLVQADLFRVPLPTALKFAATWTLTMGLGVASYHVLPRRSGGHREGPRPGLRGPHGAVRPLRLRTRS